MRNSRTLRYAYAPPPLPHTDTLPPSRPQDLANEIVEIAQRTDEYEHRFGALMHVGGYSSQPPGGYSSQPPPPAATPQRTPRTSRAVAWPAVALAQRPQRTMTASACSRPTGGSTAAARGGAGGQRSLRAPKAVSSGFKREAIPTKNHDAAGGAAHDGFETAYQLPKIEVPSLSLQSTAWRTAKSARCDTR